MKPSSIIRILKDLTQINKEKPDGIVLKKYEEDKVNILIGYIVIIKGDYHGCKLYFKLYMPENYPQSPPEMLLPTGYPFNKKFHEHLFVSSNGLSICNDRLANFKYYFKSIGHELNWNSSMTLLGLLREMQVFFADPDLPQTKLPSYDKITKMKKELIEFNNELEYAELLEELIYEDKMDNQNEIMCTVSKNYLGELRSDVFGFPVYKSAKGTTVRPVYITHQSYLDEMELEQLYQSKPLTVYNEPYNMFLPGYFNLNNFDKSLFIIDKLKLFHSIYDEFIDNYFYVMNCTIYKIIEEEITLSENIIEVLIRMFYYMKAYLKRFPDKKEHIEKSINSFIKNPQSRSKKFIPDMGVFFLQWQFIHPNLEHIDEQEALIDEMLFRQSIKLKDCISPRSNKHNTFADRFFNEYKNSYMMYLMHFKLSYIIGDEQEKPDPTLVNLIFEQFNRPVTSILNCFSRMGVTYITTNKQLMDLWKSFQKID